MPPNGQDLLERDARPALDPQVLARDEQRVPRRTSCARLGLRRRSHAGNRLGDVGPGSRTWPAAMPDLAGRELPGEVELVRRDQHRAAFGGRGAHDLVEHDAALLVETGVRLVEQQQPRVARERDRERDPAPLALREPAVRDAARRAGARAARARRRRRRPSGRRRASRSGCSRARSGRRNRTSRGRRARATAGSCGGRPRDRRRAPRPRPTATAAAPRTGAAASSCPRRSRPTSSTISPDSTSRSAPASAGNRPSMQTADRRCTTRKRAAPGTGSDTARVYEAHRPGGETPVRVRPECLTARNYHRPSCDGRSRPSAACW